MDRILVADDGSEDARSAVELAAELAGKTGAELIALAVVDAAQYSERDLRELESEGLGKSEAREWLVEGAAEYLDHCASIAARHGVIRFRAVRQPGKDPASTILNVSGECHVDLIVVGSRGHGRVPGLLIGSVSQKLASIAPCSMLIARSTARPSSERAQL